MVQLVVKCVYEITQIIITFVKTIKVQGIKLQEFWVGTARQLIIHGGHSKVIVRPVFAFVIGAASKKLAPDCSICQKCFQLLISLFVQTFGFTT